jgi:hypothetical protein
MQKAYKNKLFTLQHPRFGKKKNFVFQQIFLLIYDTQDFLKRNVHVISIHLNNHNVDYLKRNGWNGTKLEINIYSQNAFSRAEKHCISLSFSSKLLLSIQEAYKNKLLTL